MLLGQCCGQSQQRQEHRGCCTVLAERTLATHMHAVVHDGHALCRMESARSAGSAKALGVVGVSMIGLLDTSVGVACARKRPAPCIS